MDAAERRQLIDRYKAGVDEVRAALAGASDDGLDRRSDDGGWTARQVAHHLADSEMTSAIRLRRLLTEDAPAIGSYDEEEFARRLFYDDRPIGASLDAFAAARATTAEILDRLPGEAWGRAGSHPEHPTYTVEDWLRIYAAHGHEHADQIRRSLGQSPSTRS